MKDDVLSIEGRISRRVYWIRAQVVFTSLVFFAIPIIFYASFLLIWYAMCITLNLFMLLQGVKRLHDIGKSGWFILVSLIPIIGYIILIIWFFEDGVVDENKYGPDPKGRILCTNCQSTNQPWKQQCNTCNDKIFPLVYMDDGSMRRVHIFDDIQEDISLYDGNYIHLFRGGYDNYTFSFNGKELLKIFFVDLNGSKYPEIICRKVELHTNRLKSKCFDGRFVVVHYSENDKTFMIKGILNDYDFYRKY